MPQFVQPDKEREVPVGTPLPLSIALVLIIGITVAYFAWWAPMQQTKTQGQPGTVATRT